MFTPEELKSLHGFIRSTSEGNLKNMLVGGKMTEVHLRMLVKIARNCKEEEFVIHWEAGTFPKTKFNSDEVALKESCYGIFGIACANVGLLTPSKAAA